MSVYHPVQIGLTIQDNGLPLWRADVPADDGTQLVGNGHTLAEAAGNLADALAAQPTEESPS